MGSYLVLGWLAAMAVAALLLSCNGRTTTECASAGVSSSSSQASAFCDLDGPVAEKEGGTFPPSSPGVGTPCFVDVYSVASYGPVCADDPRESPGTAGTSCETASDCSSVCCVETGPGQWYPAGSIVDGGSDAEDDAGADAIGSARRVDARRIQACGCGTCLSPAAACAAARRGGTAGP